MPIPDHRDVSVDRLEVHRRGRNQLAAFTEGDVALIRIKRAVFINRLKGDAARSCVDIAGYGNAAVFRFGIHGLTFCPVAVESDVAGRRLGIDPFDGIDISHKCDIACASCIGDDIFTGINITVESDATVSCYGCLDITVILSSHRSFEENVP